MHLTHTERFVPYSTFKMSGWSHSRIAPGFRTSRVRRKPRPPPSNAAGAFHVSQGHAVPVPMIMPDGPRPVGGARQTCIRTRPSG